MGEADEGFEVFYREHYASLRRLAYRLTTDWSAADDLTQETLVRTYRSWRRIRDLDRVDLYARSVLLNRHRSILRRTMLHRERIRPPDARSESVTEDRVLIWYELARLPVRERHALVLHFYEDLPQTEIARVMGCPTGTVNSLVYRALRRLRARLNVDDATVRSEQ